MLHFERLRFHRTHLLEPSIDVRTVKFAEQFPKIWKATQEDGENGEVNQL